MSRFRAAAVLAGSALAAALLAGPLSSAAAPVTALVFSPDGKQLLASGYRSVLVRSAEGGPARAIPCPLAQVHDLVFSPDGRTLAAAGGTPGSQGSVRLLTWPDGRELRGLDGGRDLVSAVAFAPDGSALAAAGMDGVVRIFPLGAAAGEPRLLRGHAGPVLDAAYSAEGDLLVTASADRSLKAWDARTGSLLRSFTNHTGIVHAVAFRPAGGPAGAPPYCASAADDRTVRVWQPGIGRMVRIVRGHGGPVLAVAYAPDGGRLYSAGSEGIVRLLDADSDEIRHQWRAHDGWIYSLAMSPDGKRLATGDWSGSVRLWPAGPDDRPAPPSNSM